MTPSAGVAGGRRVTRWSREEIIEKIRDWNDRYGEPPCSADWNPSLARWRGQEWRIDRYRDGVWPSTNAAKRPFGGSFDAAVRAAGLEPHRPGPRRRGPGEARPVEEIAVTEPGVDTRLAAAERRAARAESRAAEARRRARRAAEQAGRARKARDRVRLAEREARAEAAERIEEIVADADARVRAALDQSEAAARDAFEERRARRAAEARAEASEARAETAERMARLARAELTASRDETEPAPSATGDAGAAWKAARAAEARAAAAEREAREVAEALCGEHRRLTAAELAELRTEGPSGPAVLAAALRRLARARAANDRTALAAALSDVASAAVRWRDRL